MRAVELIDTLLCEEQAALRRLPYVDLCELPSHAQRPVNVENRDAMLSTWVDFLPDQSVRVITQYYRPGLLGSARVHSKGFTMDRTGAARELATSELWDFA